MSKFTQVDGRKTNYSAIKDLNKSDSFDDSFESIRFPKNYTDRFIMDKTPDKNKDGESNILEPINL